MAIRINNISLDIEENVEKDISYLYQKAAKKLKINEGEIENLKILRESIDARKKNSIKFNYSIEVQCSKEVELLKRIHDKDVILEDKTLEDNIIFGEKSLNHRPLIIGMGPAGMFAGLILAKYGYKPIIIERGEKVEERTNTVDRFWREGILNPNSNVQFGEGGAGTFSDGKLTTRIKDKRCDFILRELVKGGAPENIIYRGKPHVGTDILKEVVKNIRKEIIELGGEIRFSSVFQGIKEKSGKLQAAIVNGEEIPCQVLILAIGHSSRDTYESLYKQGIFMEPKAFAIGVRVEHLQSFIDENQYGKYASDSRLRGSDYRLTYNNKSLERATYSFCMCPGGVVVAAASEENRLVTNGMSYYKRDEPNANSAVVVTVSPKDFQGHDPLSGMEFQRHYEGLAYTLGGGGYKAPIQKISDFIKDKTSNSLGAVEPSYKPGWEFRDMSKTLPPYVVTMLKEGFLDFDRKIRGFATGDGIMTGIETRTSAPLKILRNENLESVGVKGLYPAGEGAGFAGGIISAAVDGVKVAEKIMAEFATKQ